MYLNGLRTCDVGRDAILNASYYTIRDYDTTIQAFDLCWVNKNVFFLPYNVFGKLPKLLSYRAQECSITTIDRDHFKKLGTLKTLWLGRNKIEIIPHNAFQYLKNLIMLALRK